MKRFPFTPFPNGWFLVAYSNELPPRKVMPLYYFGQHLVLFRTEEGKAQVFDAYCPHLGAHLGYGGCVEGNTIRCPFHGWAFNSQGECVDIPYASKIPPKAQLRSWPICEINGLIMVYYHAQGEPPTWQIPALSTWNPKEWTPFHPLSYKIRTHSQEIFENSVDMTHMLVLHKEAFSTVEDTSQKIDGVVLTELTHSKLFLSHKLGIELKSLVEASHYGLGYQFIQVHSTGIVEYEFILVSTITPIDEEHVDYRNLISSKKHSIPFLTRLLEKQAIAETARATRKDIPIWENKVYKSYPLLSDGDGPIMQYRRWASQFYSEAQALNTSSEKLSTTPEKLTPELSRIVGS